MSDNARSDTDGPPKTAAAKKSVRMRGDTKPGDIWVVVENEGGNAGRVSWELLGKAAGLAADLGSRPAVVILGEDDERLAREAFSYGARVVYIASHPSLTPFTADPHCRALSELARKYKPEAILLGATTRGRDLASAVATDLKTGLTADCTSLEIDEETGLLKQTRPAFGGNIMATIISPDTRPQMATVRPGVFPLPEKIDGAEGEIVSTKPRLGDDLPVRQLEFIPNPSDAVSLQGAKAVIAGGRGMKKAGNFALLEELAAELDGTVAASRGAVDAGWISHQRQVGQTGQTVRPVLYIAVGISGAIQHVAGMQESDIVIAINNDPDAPIFDVADFGIVGDLFETIPALIAEIRKRKETGGAALDFTASEPSVLKKAEKGAGKAPTEDAENIPDETPRDALGGGE